MNKAELINAIANESEVSKGLSEKVLHAFTNVLSAQLASGEKLTIPGLGSFSVVDKAACTGRNPQTGEAIQITARKSVKFKAYNALNDAINQ